MAIGIRRIAISVLLARMLAGCSGVPRRPISDVATHISDTAAAGKAAFANCQAQKENCDEVAAAFDEISQDAAALKEQTDGPQ
jgi:hypothetical protein